MTCQRLPIRNGTRTLMIFLGAVALVFAGTARAADRAREQAPSPAGGWRSKSGLVTQPSAAKPVEETDSEPLPTLAAPPAPTPADALAAEPVAPPAATEAAMDKPEPTVPEAEPEEIPACIQCGATCGLIPICRCEPATRKKPRTIYESKCELVCEPGVGLFGHHHLNKPDGCTACGPACGPSRICQKKTLIKTVKEEEVCHIKREVGYICRCCAGECRGCDSPGCTKPQSRRRPPLLDWRPFAWLEAFWTE